MTLYVVHSDSLVHYLSKFLTMTNDNSIDRPHYRNLEIQPVDYIFKNKLDFLEGNVIKYVSRHKEKGGANDIRKAIHYLQMILELHYNEWIDE